MARRTRRSRPLRLTRRQAVKGLSAASAAALLPVTQGCDPGANPDIDGGPVDVDPADVIDTIVVVMMENRSFDHTYGGMVLDEGVTGLDGLTPEMRNALADGTEIAPFATPNEALCVADPPHGWPASHRQWADGAMTGFVTEHEARHGAAIAPMAMSYLTREQQPVTYALSETGALCTRWFSSVMGPTWPNRFYALAGTSDGNQGNSTIEKELPTVFERVWRSGRTYGNYYGNFPFSALNARLSLGDPEFQYLEQFYVDAEQGNLPNLTWIDPIYGRNDDHPPAHPLAGQVLLASIYDALKNSPQWERCMFIVTYDEHGGFFDHVPPPTTEDDFADEGFDQLGFRVPTFVAGPWVKPGADATDYDHTSIYATLAELWDLEPLTARDAAANSFSHLFDTEAMAAQTPHAPVELPVIEASDDELYAPECLVLSDILGSPLQLGALTGQPELEAFAKLRHGSDVKNRIGATKEVYRDFLQFTRSQGVWRPRS